MLTQVLTREAVAGAATLRQTSKVVPATADGLPSDRDLEIGPRIRTMRTPQCLGMAPAKSSKIELRLMVVEGGSQPGADRADTSGSVPDVVAPPPRHPRFPLIDGMRAIAVLAVVLVHVAVFSSPSDSVPERLLLHLNVGVTIFFLISGFLLYRPFIAHRIAAGVPPPVVSDYARRRFLRIFPAYWLILIALWISPGLTGTAGGDWLSHLLLVQTLPGTGNETSCVTAIVDCGLAQTWSLVVEFTFYVLFLSMCWQPRKWPRDTPRAAGCRSSSPC